MKSKSVGASLILNLIDRIGVKGIGFVISVLLARLLEPKAFGLIAIITAITLISQNFVDSGLSTALVQNKSVDDNDYSTVFYMSFSIALLLYMLLFFSAPLISSYYGLKELTMPFRIMALTLPVYSYSSVQAAKMTREMQFDKMLVCNIIVTILTGVIGVTMALYALQLWALVFYYLSSSVLRCVSYSFAVKWRPKPVFSAARAKELFNYGYKILFSGLLCAVFDNIRTLIIGKTYSPAELGYYDRGNQIPTVVSTTLDSVFKSVMLPVYSDAQENREKVKSLLRRTVIQNSLINFPAMVGLAVVAEPLVRLLYTDKWLFCVPFLRVLSLANITISIQSPCLISIKAVGRSDIYLKLEIVRRIVLAAILLLSLCFGSLQAIAIGWLVSNVIDLVIIMVPVKRLIGYSWTDQFVDVLPYLIISAVMGGIIYCIGFLELSIPLILSMQVAVGIMVYFLTALVFKADGMTYLLGKLKGLPGRKAGYISKT